MLGMLTFNIFISHLENGMEYTLPKSSQDTRLGRGMTDKMEVRTGVQRDLDRLEKWTDGDLHLEGASLIQQVHWGLTV